MTSPEKLLNSLLSVLSSEEIQPTSGIPAKYTTYPHRREQICELVKLAAADGFTLLPVGSGSRLGKVGKYDVAISTSRLDEQMEHSPPDMVATIPAGASFNATQTSLKEHRQRIALDPPGDNGSTLGGIVSTNAWGLLRHRYGTAKNSILATTIVNGEGNIVKAGAKVVKNVSGYDLNKLYIGARGSLGLLLDVTFRLHPLPDRVQTCSISCDSLNDALNVASACRRLPLNVETVALTNSPDWEVSVTIAGNSDARNIVEETVAGNVKWNGESAQSTMKYRVGLYDANISLPKSQLKSFLKSVSNLDKLIHWSLPDSGVCRLSFDNAEQLTKITDLVESSGGFMEVEHQPADSDLPHWPIAPPGLAWMRKIKSALDPHGIFAPDILGEGL